jgi:hypothetical protein
MLKAVRIIAGILFVLVGLTWFFQGIGVLQGSPMTGALRWAIYGGLAAAFGVGLLTPRSRR